MNLNAFDVLVIPICDAILFGLAGGIIVRALIEPFDLLHSRLDDPEDRPAKPLHGGRGPHVAIGRRPARP